MAQATGRQWRISALALAALLLGLTLAGCGQKGPLYLPQDDHPPRETRSD